MGHNIIEIVRDTTASAEAVWRWLADASSWSEWSALTSTKLERDGAPTPDGVGAIRRFARSGGSSREEVVVFDPPHHFAYVLLQGLPIRGYRSDVTLTAVGAGTRITWHSEFDDRVPGTGFVIRPFIRFVLSDISKRLVRQAERSG